MLPIDGHAVYINMDEFFDGKRGHDAFAGEGFSLELIRCYGIRVSELGDYSMEYDLKTPEQQAELANVVRFAIDRDRLTQEHLDYIIAAVKLHTKIGRASPTCASSGTTTCPCVTSTPSSSPTPTRRNKVPLLFVLQYKI